MQVDGLVHIENMSGRLFFFLGGGLLINPAGAPSTTGTRTDGGAVIRKPGSSSKALPQWTIENGKRTHM